MAESTYDVRVTGEFAQGVDPDAAAAALAVLMKLPHEHAHRLIARAPVVVKRGVDLHTAQSYLERIEQTGILCSIEIVEVEGAVEADSFSLAMPASAQPASGGPLYASDAAFGASTGERATTEPPSRPAENGAARGPQEDWAQTGEVVVEAGRVSAGHGVEWLTEGFRIFRQSPWVWMGLTLIYAIAFGAVAVIPVIGAIAVYVLQPVLTGGVMLGCEALRRGEALEISHLFKGFDTQTGRLMGLGGVYVGAMIATFLLMLLLAFVVAGTTLPFDDIWAGTESGEGIPPHLVGPLMVVVPLISILGVTVMLFVVAMMWFSPALIVLRGVDVGEALKLSLKGCLRNWLPFLVYSLVLVVPVFLATIPVMLGWFVLGPILMASIYAGYRDIYPDAEAVDRYLGEA